MNVVWPITALYSGPLGLWAYFTISIRNTRQAAEQAERSTTSDEKPMWQATAIAATHCGGGCTLGDITAEWLLLAVPFALFGMKLFASWLIDYALAFTFGIAFQYFTIRPMKGLSRRDGIVAALKADTLSLTSWQLGVYGWMAIVVFIIVGHEIPKTNPMFWFMMQIAMLAAGFATSYPVNWWPVKTGVKEKM